jgi:hypothetical protein
MGVQTMTQSEDRATIANTIDKSKQRSSAPTKDALSEQELNEVSGGLEDISFDIEQVLNIGSQSSGAGAGKVTFNPFSIPRK